MCRVLIIAAAGAFLLPVGPATASGNDDYDPLLRTFDFRGSERSYYVALPGDFDADTTYWPLVVVHGGGGNAGTNRKAAALHQFAHRTGLPAILILPEFVTQDKQVSRFPVLGEDAFLKGVLTRAAAEYRLHDRILLTGYSMGGQFSHRFAFANPDLVQACAPFAAGTWSTPDGRLLIESYGEVSRPDTFLVNSKNAAQVPEHLRDLFDARTARVAGIPAAAGAERVPFLVMCGTLDPRYEIALEFVASLRKVGFRVETDWPKTPHGTGRGKYASEFERFPAHAIRFFQAETGHQP